MASVDLVSAQMVFGSFWRIDISAVRYYKH